MSNAAICRFFISIAAFSFGAGFGENIYESDLSGVVGWLIMGLLVSIVCSLWGNE